MTTAKLFSSMQVGERADRLRRVLLEPGLELVAEAVVDGHVGVRGVRGRAHGVPVSAGFRCASPGRNQPMAAARVRIGCSGWVYRDWRGVVYPQDLPQRRVVRTTTPRLFDTVELNNTFYRLPPLTTVDQWARQAPAGLRVRAEARCVRLAPHEAARRGVVAPEPRRARAPPRRRPPVRRSCSCHRGGDATPRASTSSSPPRAPSSGGPSSCAIPIWLHDEVFDVLARTAQRSVCTICSPTIRGSSPRRGRTLGSTDRTRSSRSTWGGTAAGGCGGPPTDSAPGSTTATTSTRTSTTTGTAPRCSTRSGCAIGCSA